LDILKSLDYLYAAYDKQQENEIAAHLARIMALGRKDELKNYLIRLLKVRQMMNIYGIFNEI